MFPTAVLVGAALLQDRVARRIWQGSERATTVLHVRLFFFTESRFYRFDDCEKNNDNDGICSDINLGKRCNLH